MFDLNSFVRSAISGMIGNEPDYKVREYALGWLDRKVLTDADLAEIDAEITAYKERPPEPEPEPMEPEIIPASPSIEENPYYPSGDQPELNSTKGAVDDEQDEVWLPAN